MAELYLYLCKRTDGADYDEYDSFVGAFESRKEARNAMPSNYAKWGKLNSCWCNSPDQVDVTYLGEADTDTIEKGVILASFNAGQ